MDEDQGLLARSSSTIGAATPRGAPPPLRRTGRGARAQIETTPSVSMSGAGVLGKSAFLGGRSHREGEVLPPLVRGASLDELRPTDTSLPNSTTVEPHRSAFERS